ncbi:ABC transporter substrate-binding protein (plasmid) [Bradyrhizobium sp. CB82]|uniref:ABC transporter substrate-binding protein n=1 Tax=Bradyrhizobium sp. CB82 TaxID=3039159 RepID=UPI0024B0B5F0|nr:ABC transporter substrate-binding protein [Bradyrhizobium sp. CB82]WFU45993.1 ABC transporter substrate-binding protein [Bradyrhizobium sp. CB82]
MRRREFIASIVSIITAWPFEGVAQTASKVYRIGILSTDEPVDEKSIFDAMLSALASHGYIPDRNMALEIRASGIYSEQLPQLAKDLVASNVDVILTFSFPAALAAKNATTTIPIVSTEVGGGPVETGLVKNLSRPGGNVTGVSDMAIELAPKRLELIKDMVPLVRTVAMLWNARDLGMTLRYQGAADAARAIGARVQPLAVLEPDDFDEAFASMVRDPPDAILLVSDALTLLNRRRVYEFVDEHRLPATYERAHYVREGGLSSYSPDLDEIYDRATSLIDRILKGANPADLPFEQPTRFHLSINLKTAKSLGITVPTSVIARADEVIE